MSYDALLVAIDIDGRTVEAGTAYFTRRGRSLSTAFQYNRAYLADTASYSLDPALPLYQGQHVTSGLPGAFSDCAPDPWGRNLITKRRRTDDLPATRTPRTLDDVDFVTGVSDLTRQGAIRFRPVDSQVWLDPQHDVPKLVELPGLLHASDAVLNDSDDQSAIKALLDAGTGTLGGARPKASVRDGDRLYIAKFPMSTDTWDVMAWEKTALDLAEAAGISAPGRRLEQVDGRGVLIVERFDRNGSNRVGYTSAMTLMQRTDGDGADYVELAESFEEFASRTVADLAQMWRRAAFSVAIHNTDDHLRNHGFLREAGGWRLSPVFDVNPNPDVAEARVTGIGGAYHREQELDGLLQNRATFGLSEERAHSVLAEVFEATARWRWVAAANGIAKSEIARFTDAFDGLRDEVAKRI
jgi:serine/threonine-protein kinase HipA